MKTDTALAREVMLRASGLGLFPDAADHIQKVATDPRSSDQDLADAISLCPFAAARILKLANSAYYKGRRDISNLREAITRLGFYATRDLAVALVLGERMTQSTELGQELWRHSVKTGLALRQLSRYTRVVSRGGSLSVGLLHDMGLLAMVQVKPEFEHVVTKLGGDGSSMLTKAELLHFGMPHAILGARLLSSWQLPHQLVHAVACHHDGPPEPLPCALEFAEGVAALESPTVEDLIGFRTTKMLGLRNSQLEIIVSVYGDEVRALSALE